MSVKEGVRSMSGNSKNTLVRPWSIPQEDGATVVSASMGGRSRTTKARKEKRKKKTELRAQQAVKCTMCDKSGGTMIKLYEHKRKHVQC